MSRTAYAATLTATCLAVTPPLLLGWVYLVAVVNWHDVLQAGCATAVLVHVHLAHRRARTDQRDRRAAARDLAALARAARLADAQTTWPTGPLYVPTPWEEDDRPAWAA